MRDLFRQAGIDTAELDARLLAEAAFGMERLELVNRERELAEAEPLLTLEAYAGRRLKGEPVVRILGEKEFWSLKFRLGAATLVPRPETELLVERGLEELEGISHPSMLDLGTGTGCIPIALLTERQDLTAIAVDVAQDAVRVAADNARRIGVADRFTAYCGSWFEPLGPGERFDLITSNPPYIETATIGSLMREVREHDPALALDGGPDGLDAYRVIASNARRFLKPGGVLLLEIGSEQAARVSDILVESGWGAIEVERDLAGLDRLIIAHRD